MRHDSDTAANCSASVLMQLAPDKSRNRKLAVRELRSTRYGVAKAHWNPSIVLDTHAGQEHDDVGIAFWGETPAT
jgi:hypothetical protein